MDRPPNIVILMSDQHSPRVLGSASDPVARTPHLDRLAARGVRFATCYAGSPLCVPSRATFLTGQGCSAIGVWSNFCTMPSDVPTFAHALAAAGYDTVLCGRMHFRGPDQRHGFMQRIMGEVMGDVTGPNDGRAVEILGHIPWASQGQGRSAVTIAGPGCTGFRAFDAAVTVAAVRSIRERAARPGAGDDRPFCLGLGWISPQNPYIAPKPLFDYFYDRVRAPAVPTRVREAHHPAVRRWRDARGSDDVSPDQARTALAGYYGLVALIDEQVGQIVAARDETGQREQTAII
jgi:choline-sulfatase